MEEGLQEQQVESEGVPYYTVAVILVKNLLSFPLEAPYYIAEIPVEASHCSLKEAVMAETLAVKNKRAVLIG